LIQFESEVFLYVNFRKRFNCFAGKKSVFVEKKTLLIEWRKCVFYIIGYFRFSKTNVYYLDLDLHNLQKIKP